ncbi:MAG TPA: tetratricopeptide repeat protein [Vicinamibacterales bacterium]|nr:tetratricopeptide repeat protein [Vicinamibacterales bacterium]
MRADSIVFAVAGVLFGIIVGWVLGSQQGARAIPAAAVQAQPVAGQPAAQQSSRAVPLDQERVRALQAVAEQNPKDPQPRVQLGNMYFDAEQYPDAITWYEQAMALAGSDPNVSTDLGVAYYYSNQPDRAIAQFEHSLSLDAKHAKTWLNMGIVRAFGKQDLKGAADAWEQVVAIAPDSPEGQAAKKGLEGLKNAHSPGTTGGQ